MSFGGTAATSFVVNNATQITAIAPAHTAGTVDVAVTTPDGTSANTAADNYTYAGAPTISGLTPTNGSTVGGNAVVITGTNLTAATAVSFDGTGATSFVVNSAAQITAIAPAHAAGAVDVTVTTPGGTTANSADDDYTYAAVGVPTISGLTPTNGSTVGGNAVVITGTNLTAATAVSFDGTGATSFVVNSATQITAIAPAHGAGAVDVTVTTPGGTTANSADDDYTYAAVGVPTITGLTPTNGSTVGGNAVVITGTNLTAATAASFGGTAATSFVVNSATQITAIAPAHGAGAVDVTVTTPGGTTANSAADDYTYKTTPISDKPKLKSHREKTPVCHKPGTPAEKTKRRRPNGYRNQRLPPTLVMETRPVNARKYSSAFSTLPGTPQALVIALRVKRKAADREAVGAH